MKFFNSKNILPMCYKFHQFGYLNELVVYFQANHQELMSFRAEFPKYECSLIFNHANNQFPKKYI